MKKHLHYIASALALAVIITLSMTAVGKTAITELSGLAVAQTGSLWKNVRDYMVGDNMPDGILAAGMTFYDAAGANADRLRGTIANGILVDVTRSPGSNQTPADAFANPTTFQGVWSLGGIFNGSTWDRWRGQTSQVQGGTLLNAAVTGTADTTLNITLTGVANTHIHLYKITIRCTPAGSATYSITDNATSLGGRFVPSSPLQADETWPTGLTISTGSNAIIQVLTCGAGNTANVLYQADQF